MLNTKLILIDGITGSGKSTTAQFLANQLMAKGVDVKWYHEEETNHPLSHNDDEIFETASEVEEFLTCVPGLWKTFGENANDSNEVHIIESYLLQDSVRLLFQNNVDHTRIVSFIKSVESYIRHLNPVLIYYRQTDVDKAIRRIWARRGEDWKTWFVHTDIQTPYVKRLGLENEEGVIQLWTDYQAFTNRLIKALHFNTVDINITNGKWDHIYSEVLNVLSIERTFSDKPVPLKELKHFCGTYRSPDNELNCTVQIKNGYLVCNLIWPEIKLHPTDSKDKEIFYLESFPVFMEFKDKALHGFKTISLSGGRKKLKGKKLYNIQS